MLKIGIVGTGVMGSIISRAIDDGQCPKSALIAVNDLNSERARQLASELRCAPEVRASTELVAACDLVVEAAGPDAVGDLLPAVISKGKDLLVLSVGGLIGREETLRLAARKATRVYCPSGAIVGLDGVRAAAAGRIDGARITTRKPPAGLAGARVFDERGLNPSTLDREIVVFEGSAREACRQFPANINVSAALSLAGIGVDQTRVTIIADPHITRNMHRVEVWGDFGRLETTTENVPSDNPRTSRLAALSAIALIRRLGSSLQIGS